MKDPLQIGDRVKIPCKNCEGTVKTADSSTATIALDDSIIPWKVNKRLDGHWGDDCSNGMLILISSTKGKSIMGLKEQFALSLTKEPMKSFRKSGITNGDDLLTDEGSHIFLSWLLHNKFADEFKSAVVDNIIKEQSSSK